MIIFMNLETKKYSEKELEKYINDFTDVHWFYISEYQVLSEPFIEKYKDKLYWSWISGYQKLSENFLLNNLELINIGCLVSNEHVSEEIFKKVKFMKELQS
jgi:hypothetical protein